MNDYYAIYRHPETDSVIPVFIGSYSDPGLAMRTILSGHYCPEGFEFERLDVR